MGAEQVQEIQNMISQKQTELAELQRRLSDAQKVSPPVSAPIISQPLAPGMAAPGAMANLALVLRRLAASEVSPEEIKNAIDAFDKAIQESGKSPEEDETIKFYVDTKKMMQDAYDKLVNINSLDMPQDFKGSEIKPEASLSKSASDNPFEKKDDKEEPKEDKEESKEEKKDNPFEKKDDKKEEKKEDKPEPKKEEKKDEPKKEDKPTPKKDKKEEDVKESYEMSKSEEKGAKKAIKIIEDLIKKEKKEGLGEVEPLEMALKEIKEFLFEEKKDPLALMPEMELGKGLPGLGDMPGLDMKDPNKMDIQVTGPAVPLPEDVNKVDGPEMGMDKGPILKKLPILEKAPKMDMAKEMGLASSFNINDRVWTKSAGESYEIDDEPGRIVAIAEGKIIVDWGEEVPCEEKPENLVMAKPANGEGTMFDLPPAPEEEEVSMGLNAFTPVSHEVQKTLSSLSFADVMAQHIQANPEEKGFVTHVGTNKVGKVISTEADGRITVKFGDIETLLWPQEVR